MKLYLHVDRKRLLNKGDVLSNTKYPNGNTASLLSPILESDFLDHIMNLYNEGISPHGYNYLVEAATGTRSYLDWATELFFEYIRYKEFNSLPSRYQSIFGWSRLEDALSFDKKSPIYEISNNNGCFIADIRLLKMDYDPSKQANNAKKYWKGEPLDSSLTYKPLWEYVINIPVTVEKRIDLRFYEGDAPYEIL